MKTVIMFLPFRTVLLASACLFPVAAFAGETLTVKTRPGKPAVEGYDARACFPIREIRIAGIEVVPAEDIRRKVEPLAVECLDNALATAIVKAINDVHVEKGYVTTQGFLPDQDIRKDRRLTINVHAGRIGKVVYSEPDTDESRSLRERWDKGWENLSGAKGAWGTLRAASVWLDSADDPLDDFQIIDTGTFPNLKRWLAFGSYEGDILHIDDVQRNTDFMNRIPSNRTQAKLRAGDKPATSDVVYENRRSDAFRLNVGFETNGAALNGTGSTVDRRLRADIAKDNLIGVNDSWRAALASGINTNEATAGFTLPVRRFTFVLNGSYSESLSAVASGVQLFQRTGIVSGALSYNLERNNSVQSSIDSSLTWRRSDRNVNGSRLTEQKISIARVGFSRTHLFEGHQFYYGAGINKGLTIWDATRDGPRPLPSTPRAQFWKIDGSTGFIKRFQDIGTFRVDVTGQWTDHPLYSDDQLTLGSSTTVRGFTNTAAKVDRGLVARSEFAFALPADRLLGDMKENLVLIHEILTSAQPYVFVDYGYGWELANNREISRSGAGIGLRYNHGRLNFDVAYAHPILSSGTRAKRGPEIYLTASLKLF